jgi:hypothetical protein
MKLRSPTPGPLINKPAPLNKNDTFTMKPSGLNTTSFNQAVGNFSNSFKVPNFGEDGKKLKIKAKIKSAWGMGDDSVKRSPKVINEEKFKFPQNEIELTPANINMPNLKNRFKSPVTNIINRFTPSNLGTVLEIANPPPRLKKIGSVRTKEENV